MGILEWSYWAEKHCPFVPNAATPYLLLPHSGSSLLTVALFAIGLVMHEWYLFMLGIGVTLNSLLNLLLKWLFMGAVPYNTCGMYHMYCIANDAPWVASLPNSTHLVPPNACGTPPWPAYDPASPANCGAPPLDPCAPCVSCGMPAYEAQETAFLVTSIFLYMLTWRHPHIETKHHILLVAWLDLSAWSHTFFGFNSPAQALAGIGIGAVLALVWHFFVFICVYPHVDAMLQWRIMRMQGYRDTFCRSYKPVPGDPVVVVDDDDNK